MAVKVRIEKGTHTINVPHGMAKLIERTLEEAGLNQGEFKVWLGPRIQGSNHAKGVKVGQFLPSLNAFKLRVQSKSNDGCHLTTVYFPELYRLEAQTRYDDLCKIFEVDLSEDVPLDAEIMPTPEIIESTENQAAIELSEAKNIDGPARTFYDLSILHDDETVILILSDIFSRYGVSWITKNDLFEIIRNQDLKSPENLIIGKLLSRGMLEKDPDRPTSRSRLSSAALDMMRKRTEINDSAQILGSRIAELQKLSDEYQKKKEVMDQFADAIRKCSDEEKAIQSIIDEEEKKKQLTKDRQLDLMEQMKQVEESITPAMLEGIRRHDALIKLLSEPLPE